jgi:hypothetical protein
MELNCRTETNYFVGYKEMERFINACFPNAIPIEIPMHEEKGNDCTIVVDVCGKDYFPEDIDKYIAGEREPLYMLNRIMQRLHNMGKLKTGKYCIEISW